MLLQNAIDNNAEAARTAEKKPKLFVLSIEKMPATDVPAKTDETSLTNKIESQAHCPPPSQNKSAEDEK